jgi:DNA-binding MurR/RpiR family transcriptional regulator
MGEERRVLICGGRDYDDAPAMEAALRRLLQHGDVVIHGGARGADAMAGDIAGRLLGHAVEVYPADWHKHGKAAGPIRNQQMLGTGIDLVIAFSGGRGTADMVNRARRAGVAVAALGGDDG